MDVECIPLCDAINELPGLYTIDSCCGHNKKPFRIWFEARSLKHLPALLYYFDSCHCGFDDWRVLVTTDCAMSPVRFRVEGNIGAYKEANTIAILLSKALKAE